MDLKTKVLERLRTVGSTVGSQKLALQYVLDNQRDIFQFMQLWSETDILCFYGEHCQEVEIRCAEQEMFMDSAPRDKLKFALEQILMEVEETL